MPTLDQLNQSGLGLSKASDNPNNPSSPVRYFTRDTQGANREILGANDQTFQGMGIDSSKIATQSLDPTVQGSYRWSTAGGNINASDIGNFWNTQYGNWQTNQNLTASNAAQTAANAAMNAGKTLPTATPNDPTTGFGGVSPTGQVTNRFVAPDQTGAAQPTLANGQAPGGLQMPNGQGFGLQMPDNGSGLVFDPTTGTQVTPAEKAFNETKAAGTPAPQSGGEVGTQVADSIKKNTPPNPAATTTPNVDAFYQNNETLQQQTKDLMDFLSPPAQQQQIQDQLTKISGEQNTLSGLNIQAMNLDNLMSGQTDSIGKEIAASGSGLATTQQILALSSARNKNLLLTQQVLQQKIATVQQAIANDTTLLGQEKDMANTQFSQRSQIYQLVQKNQEQQKSSAKDSINTIVNAVGYGGLLATLHSDPTAIASVEKSLGLQPGGLQGLVTQQQNQTNLAALTAAGGVKTPFVNNNGEIQNSKTGEAYSNPQAFFNAAGVSSFAEAEKKGLISPMPVSLDTQQKQADLAYKQAETYKALHPTTSPSSPNSPSSPTGQQSVSNDVQAILEGRNTMYNIRQTMGRTNAAAAYMQQVRDQITKTDPNFDFVASDAGGKSVSTGYVQKATAAINSVLPNIEKVIDLSNQVSRVGVAGVDKILQAGNVQLNNQKVSNFHEAQKLIADEIGVALGAGSVSDMKLQLGFDVTDPSVSQEVFASNMGIVKEFIQNRLSGLQSLRYSSSTVSPQSAGSSDYNSYLQAIGQ